MSSPQSPQFPHFRPAPWFNSQGQRLLYGVGGCPALFAFFATWSKLKEHVFSSSYLPHFYCYLGSRALIWTHVVTDSLIGVSYLAISVTLAHIVYRARREIPFHWMFLAFGLFIVACGLTHFMEVVTVWDPVYVLAAVVKGFTAAASVAAAIMLPFIVSQVLLMIHRARESEQYLRFLESGLVEREVAQGELRRINELLEERVRERTLELARANETLKASESQYRLLFEGNPMPMWVFDRGNLEFLAVNEAAIHHYGYSQDEFLSMTIADIRPKEDVPKLIESVSSRAEGLSKAELWRHKKKGYPGRDHQPPHQPRRTRCRVDSFPRCHGTEEVPGKPSAIGGKICDSFPVQSARNHHQHGRRGALP